MLYGLIFLSPCVIGIEIAIEIGSRDVRILFINCISDLTLDFDPDSDFDLDRYIIHPPVAPRDSCPMKRIKV